MPEAWNSNESETIGADTHARSLYTTSRNATPSDRQGDMSGSTLSAKELDVRRKRILFRCWHRGMKEMDLLLGRFADARLPSLTEEQLDSLETLMEIGDQELFAWMSGRKAAPEDIRDGIFRDILAFHDDKSSGM